MHADLNSAVSEAAENVFSILFSESLSLNKFRVNRGSSISFRSKVIAAVQPLSGGRRTRIECEGGSALFSKSGQRVAAGLHAAPRLRRSGKQGQFNRFAIAPINDQAFRSE
jgi:hypothetical protein